MIESILIKYLEKKLNKPIFTEVPDTIPNEYVIVEKVGGTGSIFYEKASVAIQSYSTTLLNAAKLNRDVKKAMFNINELDKVISCNLDSDYNYTDEETKQYRYQAVFDIAFYD